MGKRCLEVPRQPDGMWPLGRRRQLQVQEPLFTGLHRPLGSPSEHIDVVVHPWDDVAWHVRGAVGDVDDLLCPEDTVPYVELAKLSNKGLCGIKSASHSVLESGRACWDRFTSRTGLLTLQGSEREGTTYSTGPEAPPTLHRGN